MEASMNNRILEEINARLEAMEETLQLMRQNQIRSDSRMDHFRHKLIALEASLDEKLGQWKQDQQAG